MSLPRVLCIVGPTASGKSSVADLAACGLGGEVVSVDSMQIYRGMDIGTAKTPVGQRKVALHMVDVTDFSSPYSASLFQAEARRCVNSLLQRSIVPVLCGGTGLYLDAVIDNMNFPKGEQESSRRKEYERLATQKGPAYLYGLLLERDPQSAHEIHPHNLRRVIRALELCDEGVSYAQQHKGLKKRTPYYDATIWALTLPREMLYRRIEERVEAMMSAGLYEEVQTLAQAGLRGAVTASQAIGYKEMLMVLDGVLSLDEAVEQIKRNTRRYAKRQLSWIARDGRAREIDMTLQSVESAAQIIVDEWRSHS